MRCTADTVQNTRQLWEVRDLYYKTLNSNDFQLQSDGKYKAVIPASSHGLGVYYRVSKFLRLDGDNVTWRNFIPAFKILENGDFELYTDEMCVCMVTLVGE